MKNSFSLNFFLFLITLILSACSSISIKKNDFEIKKKIKRINDIYKKVSFEDLPGWKDDNLNNSWDPFIKSCKVLIYKKPKWEKVCKDAFSYKINNLNTIRKFFEEKFQPYKIHNIDGSKFGIMTGYYEPLLNGSRTKKGNFQIPIYKSPDDLLTIQLSKLIPKLKNLRLRGRLKNNSVIPYFSRKEIEEKKIFKGEEIIWVDDPVDAFFLHIQGSGRVSINDSNKVIRVAYDNQNGHPYRSIGKYLIEKGELTLENVSMQGIKSWIKKNPHREKEILNFNPSYVFFREEEILDPKIGPKGAFGVPLTPERSIAVDPQYIPLGAPIFISTTKPNSKIILRKLMFAQDTGGVIKGALRTDFFWGFGTSGTDC